MTRLRLGPKFTTPLDLVTQTVVIYGAKGMGKTNLGGVIVEELHAARRRFVVLDPIGNWWGLRHDAGGKGPGLPILLLGGRHGDIPIEPTAGAVVADLVADEDVDVVVDISRRPDGTMWSIRERIRFATEFFKRLYQRQGERRRPRMLIVDEAARFAPQLIQRGAEHVAECQGALEVIVEEGRNVGLGVTLITQRSARLAKSVAELAECMIAFRTIGPRSVGAILDWFGEHVPKSRWNELVEQLRKLPRGQALVVSPGWLEYEGVAEFRVRETFDSSATPTGGRERRATGRASKPDLAKYQQRMAATIEKVKADDPAVLRRRIAELEREAKSRPAAATAAKAPKKVEVPVLTAATVKRLEAAVARYEKIGHSLAKMVTATAAKVEAGGKPIEAAFIAVRDGLRLVTGTRAPAVSLAKVPLAPSRPFKDLPARMEKRELQAFSDAKPKRIPTVGTGGITPPLQRILNTVAMLEVRGIPPDVDNVARWMDLHPRNGTYRTNLGALRAQGYLEGWSLTATGRAIADPGKTGRSAAFDALPDESKKRILQAVIDAVDPVTLEELAARLSLHPRNGTFRTNLGRLRTMGLITERQPIQVTEALER